MAIQSVECPHCGGEYFNYSERRTTERVGLQWENGGLKISGGGSPKTLVIVAECRSCGGEYDECDLREHLEESAEAC